MCIIKRPGLLVSHVVHRTNLMTPWKSEHLATHWPGVMQNVSNLYGKRVGYAIKFLGIWISIPGFFRKIWKKRVRDCATDPQYVVEWEQKIFFWEQL